MAGPIPLLGLLDELRDFANRRNMGQKLVGGGIKGAAIRGLLGMDAPENATKAEKEVYENATRASAPVMGLAAAPAAIKTAGRALKDAPRAQALETARQNAVKMLGLPENNTAMDRARAMGFADADLYHATTKDFPAFDLSKIGSGATISKTEKAVFSSKNPQVSEEFVAGPYYNDNGQIARQYLSGANVIPLKVRMNNPQGWEMSGGSYDAEFIEQALKDARKSKADSVVFKNMRDPSVTTVGRGDPSTIVATLKPQTLRSRFAAFDPARINENNLLASLAAMGISIPVIMGLLDEERVD
jgi:hypothetical protein